MFLPESSFSELLSKLESNLVLQAPCLMISNCTVR